LFKDLFFKISLLLGGAPVKLSNAICCIYCVYLALLYTSREQKRVCCQPKMVSSLQLTQMMHRWIF